MNPLKNKFHSCRNFRTTPAEVCNMENDCKDYKLKWWKKWLKQSDERGDKG